MDPKSYQERLAERIDALKEEIFLWTRDNPDYTVEQFEDKFWPRLSNVLTDCDWTGFGIPSETQQVAARRREKAHGHWLHHLDLLLGNIQKTG